MASLSETINELSVVFQSPLERTVVSLVAIGAALTIALATRRWEAPLEDHVPPVAADLITTLSYLTSLAVASVVTAGVWGQAELVASLLRTDAVSPETVLPRLIVSLLVLILARVVTNFTRRLAERVAESRDVIATHERELFQHVVQIVMYSAAVMVLLGIWNFDIQGLLIGAGFLGIVVGMAARQSLGAVFAGFVLMFSRPFEVGDWVVIGDTSGVVRDITIVHTIVETYDGEQVVFPNDIVNAQTVTNRSHRNHFRVEVEVGVDYDDDVEHAREVAREAIAEVDLVQDAPQPSVVAKRFGDSAVVLGMRFWISDPSAPRMWSATTDVVQAVKAAFDREGVSIPFPQRALSGREVPEGFELVTEDGSAAPATDGGEGGD
jgi:small conductance mechanosensitive channel